MLAHFVIINECLSQCGQNSFCLALGACIKAELITFSVAEHHPPPHVHKCYIANRLPLPKSQAFGAPPYNNSSVLYLLDNQPIYHWAPFIICIDSHVSIAEPICRPSLGFLVSFNDKGNHHLELTRLQSIHVKLKDVHLTHLDGPKISPTSVALNNLTTKSIGTFSLCKSEPLNPWYHLRGGLMEIKSMGHQLAGWGLIWLTEGMCLNTRYFN